MTDFIRLCEDETDIELVVTAFRDAVRPFGFVSSACGAWIGEGPDRLQRFYFNDWPNDWKAIHQQTSDFNDDPVVIEAGRRMKPFVWSQLRRDIRPTAAGRALIAAFDAFGWGEVFATPFHGPAGYVGLVTLAAMRPVTLDYAQKAALESMALHVHRRCRETPGYGVGTPRTKPLTERQLLCLRWVAAGKVDAEIAELIGVSTSTVHYHVEQAKTRLGVHSRNQAVSLLVLAGEL